MVSCDKTDRSAGPSTVGLASKSGSRYPDATSGKTHLESAGSARCASIDPPLPGDGKDDRNQDGIKEARSGVKFGQKKQFSPPQIIEARKLIAMSKRVKECAALWD